MSDFSSLLFVDTHRDVLRIVRLCGYPLAWMEGSGEWRRFFRIYYCFFFLLNAYMLACVVVSLCFLQTMAEFTSLMVPGLLTVAAVLSNIYFSTCDEEIRSLIHNIDEMRLAVQRSPIGRPKILANKLQEHSRFVSLLTKISVFGIGAAAIFFIVPIPLPGVERKAFLPLLTGFHGSKFSNDAFSVFWKTITLTLTASKKTALDCFFITLFRLQVIYSEHLTDAIRVQGNGGRFDYKSFREWIILHQKLDRNNRALIKLFAPIIVIYYVNLLTIFASSIYILLSNEDTNSIQGLMDILWLISLLILLHLQCSLADDLGVESCKMAQAAFDLSVFGLDKSSGQVVRMAILYTNRPIMVTAYRAPVFLMNRESFVGFIMSVVSCYVTLKRLDGHFEVRDNIS
nr:olfactory receptor 17 [Tropidothorax elegans]